MKTIYICRHGETEFNKQKRMMGWIDSPLTEKGIENAHTIARKLNGISIDNIYSSDMGRAFITAYIITSDLHFTKEIIRSTGIRDANFGNMTYLPYEDAEKLYPPNQLQDTNFTPVGGESLANVQIRSLAFLESLPEETSLLVCHDHIINALYTSYANIDLGPYNYEHYNPHDFVAKFTYKGNKITSYFEIE